MSQPRSLLYQYNPVWTAMWPSDPSTPWGILYRPVDSIIIQSKFCCHSVHTHPARPWFQWFSWLVGCILGSVAWNVPSLHCRGGISFAETPNFQVIMYYEDYYIRQTCMLHALIYMLLLTNLSLSLSLSPLSLSLSLSSYNSQSSVIVISIL